MFGHGVDDDLDVDADDADDAKAHRIRIETACTRSV